MMTARTMALAGAACALLLAARPASAQADLALVMAVDVSSSVDDGRFSLQREGIASGLESQEILNAIAGGPHRTIELAIVEWSERQYVVVDWTVIHGRADLEAVLQALRTNPRPQVGFKTNVAGGMIEAIAMFDSAPLAADRRVIDVSGDGQQNEGNLTAEEARDAAVARDITINGLPITSGDEPEVDRWYGAHVIGGDGAFLIVANGHEAFSAAMRKKLTLEVAGATRRRQLARID